MPIMKQAKADGKDAYISVDKLYIDGVQYIEATQGSSSSTSMPRRGARPASLGVKVTQRQTLRRRARVIYMY